MLSREPPWGRASARSSGDSGERLNRVTRRSEDANLFLQMQYPVRVSVGVRRVMMHVSSVQRYMLIAAGIPEDYEPFRGLHYKPCIINSGMLGPISADAPRRWVNPVSLVLRL